MNRTHLNCSMARRTGGSRPAPPALRCLKIASRMRGTQCEIAQNDEPLRERVVNGSLAHCVGLLFKLGARIAHRVDIGPRTFPA